MHTTVGAALSVRLLGELELRLGDRPLPPLESARAESLLAYLLIHRDAPQPRQRLAFVLWPDSTEAQARTNLRHVLHTLRRALHDADRYLDVTPRTLRWRPEAPVRLDLAELEAALDRADRAADPLDDLEAAVGLYAGDLLEQLRRVAAGGARAPARSGARRARPPVGAARAARRVWYLGDTEAAVAARGRALELADEIGDPWTTGIALVFAALLALEQDDVDGLRDYTARLAGYDMPPIQITRELYAGYLDAIDGRPEGVARIRRAIAAASGKDHAPGLHAVAARVLVAACLIAGDRAGLDVPVPRGLFERAVRRLQGTLAERTVPDPARP